MIFDERCFIFSTTTISSYEATSLVPPSTTRTVVPFCRGGLQELADADRLNHSKSKNHLSVVSKRKLHYISELSSFSIDSCYSSTWKDWEGKNMKKQGWKKAGKPRRRSEQISHHQWTLNKYVYTREYRLINNYLFSSLFFLG